MTLEHKTLIQLQEIERPFSQSITFTLNERSRVALVDNSFGITLVKLSGIQIINATMMIISDGRITILRRSLLEKINKLNSRQIPKGLKNLVTDFRSNRQEEDSIYIDGKYLLVGDNISQRGAILTTHSTSPVNIQFPGIDIDHIRQFKKAIQETY